MSKIKLFHFVSNLVGGGAQTQLLLLVKNLSSDNYENYIIYTKAPEDFNYLDYSNVYFIKGKDFKKEKLKHLTSNFLIHIWMPDVFTYFSPFKFLKYRKFVIIGIRNKYQLDNVKRLYQLLIFSLFNNFASNTPYEIHSRIHKFVYGQKGYKFIPNAIKYKICDDNFHYKVKSFLFVGRLVKQKGIKELISTFTNLKEKKITLSVIGSGTMEKELKLLASRNVSFLGYLPNPQKEFLNHKFFVLPSYYEGMPNVAFEALSNNCLLLLSDISQHKVWFSSEQAIYFKPASVDSLNAAIEKALTLSEIEIESMVVKAKKTLSNLTIEKYLVNYENYYKNVINENI